jgi:hypothetical protein
MPSVAAYRIALRAEADWPAYLAAHSNLPGPRGNIELGQACAEEAPPGLFAELLARTSAGGWSETNLEYWHFCGTLGLGRLLAGGDFTVLPRLRTLAADPRWRVREAVAMAIQRWGRADFAALLSEMTCWAYGSRLEQRAVVAGLCEPDLLAKPGQAAQVIKLLNQITAGLPGAPDRRTDEFVALRKALGYGWSVSIVADPVAGKPAFERWADNPDADIQWLVRENLDKKRLERIDSTWVNNVRQNLKK